MEPTLCINIHVPKLLMLFIFRLIVKLYGSELCQLAIIAQVSIVGPDLPIHSFII